jgi:hypothetical protein
VFVLLVDLDLDAVYCESDRMPDEQIEYVAKTFSTALDKIAGTMDKHGTSAWIASVGLLLIGFCLATTVGDWGTHLPAGEFIAVLVVGLIFVLIGISYRLYVRMAADAALRGDVKRRLEHAGELEEAAAEQKRSAAKAVEEMAGAAPKG